MYINLPNNQIHTGQHTLCYNIIARVDILQILLSTNQVIFKVLQNYSSWFNSWSKVSFMVKSLHKNKFHTK